MSYNTSIFFSLNYYGHITKFCCTYSRLEVFLKTTHIHTLYKTPFKTFNEIMAHIFVVLCKSLQSVFIVWTQHTGSNRFNDFINNFLKRFL